MINTHAKKRMCEKRTLGQMGLNYNLGDNLVSPRLSDSSLSIQDIEMSSEIPKSTLVPKPGGGNIIIPPGYAKQFVIE